MAQITRSKKSILFIFFFLGGGEKTIELSTTIQNTGGSFHTFHLYDIANTNTTVQAIIYNAISKKSYAKLYLGDMTLALIDLEKNLLRKYMIVFRY